MKREKTEPTESRKSLRRHTKQIEQVEEKPQPNGGKKLEGLSLVDRTFELLDLLSRRLNQPGQRQMEQEWLGDVKEVFLAVAERMSLQEMHSLEYSNRLHYIKSAIQNKNTKNKNWTLLAQLIDAELARVEQLYINYLQNCDYLQALKQRYDPSLQE